MGPFQYIGDQQNRWDLVDGNPPGTQNGFDRPIPIWTIHENFQSLPMSYHVGYAKGRCLERLILLIFHYSGAIFQ